MDFLAFTTALFLGISSITVWSTSRRSAADQSFQHPLSLYLLFSAISSLWPMLWLEKDPTPFLSIAAVLFLLCGIGFLAQALATILGFRSPHRIGMSVAIAGGILWIFGKEPTLLGIFFPLVSLIATAGFLAAARKKSGDFRHSLQLMAFAVVATGMLLSLDQLTHIYLSPFSQNEVWLLQFLLNAFGAVCWLSATWLWYRATVWVTLPKWLEHSPRRFSNFRSYLIVFLLFGILAIGGPLIEKLTRVIDTQRRNELNLQTKLSSLIFSDTLIASLQGIPSESNQPAYLALKASLADLATEGNFKFTYLIFRDGENIRFLADSSPVDAPDEVKIGTIWKTAPPAIRELIFSDQPNTQGVTAGPYTDEWGTWITGIAPVANCHVQSSPVWLCMDRPADTWYYSLLRIRQSAMGFLFAILMVLITTFVILRINLEAEWKLADSEERLRMSLLGANMLPWDYNQQTHTFRLDPTLRHLLNLSVPTDELSDSAFFQLIKPEDYPLFQKNWKDLLEGKSQELNLEIEMVKSDNAICNLHWRGRILPATINGQAYLISGTVQDTSARHQEKEILRLHSAALDAAANTIFITNALGNIEWVNPAFCNSSGYSALESIGNNPRFLKSGIHPSEFYQTLWDTLQEGKVWSGKVTNRHKDGHLYTEEAIITPLKDDHGKITHFIAVKQDITEKEQAQEALKLQHQNLEKINATLLALGADYEKNMLALTLLACEIFNAQEAIYHRTEDDVLLPPGADAQFLPYLKDTFATEIAKASDHLFSTSEIPPLVIPQANNTPQNKKNITTSFIGKGIFVEGKYFGTLCLLFKDSRSIKDQFKECLSLIAQAMGREEMLRIGRTQLNLMAHEEASARNRIATFLEHLSDAVLVEDATRTVVFVNPAFQSFFGIPPSQILGKNCADLGVAAAAAFENPQDFLRAIDEAIASGKAVQGEVLSMLDGRHLLRNFAPIRDTETFYGYIWHYRDITRQHNNELLLGAVANLASYVLANPLTSTQAWNQALSAMGSSMSVDRIYAFQHFPASATSPVRCSQIAGWIHPDFTSQLTNPDLQNLDYEASRLSRWLQLLENGHPVLGILSEFPTVEQAVLKKLHILSIILVPIRVRGQLWGFIGFDDCRRSRSWETEEISLLQSAAGILSSRLEQQESHADLVQSEEKFRGMFEFSPLGMVIHDLETGAFLEANDALLRMIGYTSEELLTLDYRDITPEKYQTNDKNMLVFLQERGSYGPYEKEYRHHSGHAIPVLLHGLIIPGPNGKSRVWSIVQDISERKQWEESLQHAKEVADAANRAKSTFLATMSHEIRTPLNAIIGIASILTETTLPEQERNYVKTIFTAGETLLELITDILDYTKIEAGKIELESIEYALPDLIDEVISIITPLTQEKENTISTSLAPSLSSCISGDRKRTKQVLINLLANAVKFTAKGKITLTVTPTLFENNVPGICFSVQDTGIGIAPEVLSTLFQPFRQADSSITRKYGGSGLGLALSKRLVELMGGTIQVQSTLNTGSCFSFTLPLIDSNQTITTAPTILPPPSSQPILPTTNPLPETMKILVAEDNTINQAVIAAMFKALGHVPTMVANGKIAVEYLSQELYHLVLMDMQMPVMDGIEATRLIRAQQDPAIPAPYITALTANAFVEDQAACTEAGMDEYITKPIKLTELKALIERAKQRFQLS